MNKIFISYRREDTGTAADRLFSNLSKEFGRRQVFMDFNSLKPGTDFVEQIIKTISSCKAMIVFIGPQWLNKITQNKAKKKDSLSHDYVEVEVAAGLDLGIPIIPLLLDGAKMPSEKELPSGLEPFAKYHAFEITTKRWQYDVKSLIAALNDVTGAKWKRKALFTAGGTGAVAGASGANALLSVLGAAGLKTTIPVLLATWPTAIIAGGGIASYLTYKGVKRLLNNI